VTKEFKPRAVRISISDAVVTFMGKPATLVNISRTGALLRVRSLLQVEATGQLTISHNHTTIQLEGRVVRAAMATTAGGPNDGDWTAGLTFIAPPPPEITALLRRIISLG
jgi:hypothetical protein